MAESRNIGNNEGLMPQSHNKMRISKNGRIIADSNLNTIGQSQKIKKARKGYGNVLENYPPGGHYMPHTDTENDMIRNN